jgi:hypothetical protein
MMSYDVSIGGECFNYTSNVAPLFYDHMPDGIKSLDGMTGREASLRIASAFEGMDRTRHELWENGAIGEPKFCAKYDEKNGWGSLVGGLMFLALIQGACIRHPRSEVRVSW